MAKAILAVSPHSSNTYSKRTQIITYCTFRNRLTARMILLDDSKTNL